VTRAAPGGGRPGGIAVVGGGRMGRALTSALSTAGEAVRLWSRGGAGAETLARTIGGVRTVILAVPDDAIRGLAETIAAEHVVGAGQVVLHLSGLLGREDLTALARRGAAVGSLHPLQTVSDPSTAAARWRGAYAAVEGDEPAVREATRLAELLGMIPLRLPPGSKPAYHAGAVFASNFVVVLAAIAGRLARNAGVPTDLADRIYLPLLEGAVHNLRAGPPVDVLTGPVRRGDVETVRAHLEALPSSERRLYVALAMEALRLAREAGLAPRHADELEALLGGADAC
jgi:predicted short-subunit dehydrogenase-like oxidoreductase (DUF2520 family)